MHPPVVIIYHKNCADGFGAAYAAWKRFGDHATYIACSYGDPMPAHLEGKVVYIIDFSFPRQQMIELRERVVALVVLDHHKTAQADMQGLEFAKFDMEKSGAMMAWNYFHAEEPVPALIEYIQDRDLWQFKLPDSHAVSNAIFSYPYDFQVWDQFDIEQLRTEGKAIKRANDQTVEMICNQAKLVEIDGQKVAVVNATSFWSEVGNTLCKKFPEAAYSASYYDAADGYRKWSLRSIGEFDVSAIAKKHNGGGHKNAAGYIEVLAK